MTFSLELSSADPGTVTSIPTSPLRVDVWLHLDVPQITAGTLSYSMLYDRQTRQLQDKLQLASGQEVTGAWFPCPTGTFFTVEVSCRQNSASACHVEFWNNPKHPKFGKSQHDLYVSEDET